MRTSRGKPLIFFAASIGLGVGLVEVIKRKRALDLKGQVVLITGSSRGLGLAMAQEFARQGARLVICARQSEPLEIARQQLAALDTEVLAVPCDVQDRDQVQHLVNQALVYFGRIDILVTNAGVISGGPLAAMTLQGFEEAMNIMFWGSVYPVLAVLPHMRERKSGRIVNITSVGGKVSIPHLLPYSSAKFAAVGFSEGLHAELARDGIQVVTVIPGLMRTGSHVNALFKGQAAKEYSLFAPLATLPITSINAARAARQIVHATRRGQAELIITFQAQLLALFHGLFPGLTTTLLSVVNRLLPDAQGADTHHYSGRQVRPGLPGVLSGLGEAAAHKYNQYAKPE